MAQIVSDFIYDLGGIHLVRTQGEGGRGYDRCVHLRTVGEGGGLNRCFVRTHNDILGPISERTICIYLKALLLHVNSFKYSGKGNKNK
jgi:hypothetical protein